MLSSGHLASVSPRVVAQRLIDRYKQFAAAARSGLRQVSCAAAVRSNSAALPVFDSDLRQKKPRGRPSKNKHIGLQQDYALTDSPQQEPAQLPVTSNGHSRRSNRTSDSSNRSRSRQPVPAVQQYIQHSSTNTAQPQHGAAVAAPRSPKTVRTAAAAAPQTTAAEADPPGAESTTDAVSSGILSTASGQMPPERVWRAELRPLSGLMSDPNKPWVQPFILKHCYGINTPETRQKFVALAPADMHKLIKWRLQVEMHLVKSAHSLSAAWRRLQLLSAAVGDQGKVLSLEQLNKEREQIVAMLDSVKDGQQYLARAVTTAAELDDQRYLTKADTYRQLLATMMATTDSYLREYLRRVSAASRINLRFQQQWQNTPEPLREPLHVLEGRRQQQLMGLQSVCPDHPTQLLADYRAVAIKFELYPDKQLKQRKSTTGQPSSTGGIFWEQSSTEGTLPVSTPTAAAAGSIGPVAAAVPTSEQQQIPLKASWKQNPQQLMARPLQQLPLLPHLGKHRQWLAQLEQQQQQVRQQEVPLQLQLQALQQQQQQLQGQAAGDLSGEQQRQQLANADQALQQQQRIDQMRSARLDPDGLQRPALPTAAAAGSSGSASDLQDLRSLLTAAAGISNIGLPDSAAEDIDHIRSPAVTGPMFSYSGKVIPPMPVLLQRALQLEDRLIAEEDRKRAMFAANNAHVKAQRDRQW